MRVKRIAQMSARQKRWSIEVKMKIFGHKWIPSATFYKIDIVEDIPKTLPNSILLLNSLEQDIEIIHYCQCNHLIMALEIESITEAIFANALGVKYIFIPKNMAQEIMQIAQNYLFDTQILMKIESMEEIESLAKIGIDGIVFDEAIKHFLKESPFAKSQ